MVKELALSAAIINLDKKRKQIKKLQSYISRYKKRIAIMKETDFMHRLAQYLLVDINEKMSDNHSIMLKKLNASVFRVRLYQLLFFLSLLIILFLRWK